MPAALALGHKADKPLAGMGDLLTTDVKINYDWKEGMMHRDRRAALTAC